MVNNFLLENIEIKTMQKHLKRPGGLPNKQKTIKKPIWSCLFDDMLDKIFLLRVIIARLRYLNINLDLYNNANHSLKVQRSARTADLQDGVTNIHGFVADLYS